MKKSLIACAVVMCLLVGCSNVSNSLSDTSSENFHLEVSSGSMSMLSSSSEAENTMAPFSEDDFLNYFEETHYAHEIPEVVSTTADIDMSDPYVVMLIQGTMQYSDKHYGTSLSSMVNNESSSGYYVYSLDGMIKTANEMFNIDTDFNQFLNSSETAASILTIDGVDYVDWVWGYDFNSYYTPKKIDFDLESNIISLNVETRSGYEDEGPLDYAARTFIFKFIPENTICPYQLVSISPDESYVPPEGESSEPDSQASTVLSPGYFQYPESWRFNPGTEHSLELKADGSCVLKLNYLEGVCTYLGTYSIEDGYIVLHLTSSNPDGFINDYFSSEQRLRIVDANTLEISEQLDASLAGESLIRM
ncbi:copper resistance protein NlpE [Ruminococcaceae bacterium OttesenSCG-928-I18]|nr:copper resistance protein NlpE [Ruminococcaceae bacterium OttesenSCG-928-I18]